MKRRVDPSGGFMGILDFRSFGPLLPVICKSWALGFVNVASGIGSVT